MGARLAKMEAPLDGSGGDASLLPPAARAGMVRRRRRRLEYTLRVGRPFFLSISRPLECECGRNRHRFLSLSLSLCVSV